LGDVGFGMENHHCLLSSSCVGSGILPAQGPLNVPKVRKVQPYASPDLDVVARWARAAVVARTPGSGRFIHQMKEPDEGSHSRIM
jgi:hypothetical protein